MDSLVAQAGRSTADPYAGGTSSLGPTVDAMFRTYVTPGAPGTALVVTDEGRVGVRTATPAFVLHVNGSAGKPGGGSWSVSSDRRLKQNVRDLEGALERLLELRGVTYEYRDPAAIGELPGRRTGMVAQEVQAVFPDWVEPRADGYLSITCRGFEALAIEALRDLRDETHAELDSLAERIEALGADAARVAALELQYGVETPTARSSR